MPTLKEIEEMDLEVLARKAKDMRTAGAYSGFLAHDWWTGTMTLCDKALTAQGWRSGWTRERCKVCRRRSEAIKERLGEPSPAPRPPVFVANWHEGDPCMHCGIAHDEVTPGPCPAR